MKTSPHRLPHPSDEAPLPFIEVRRSSVHGDGVFATRALRAGQKIGDYGGRRYPPDQGNDDWDGGLTYLFGLSDGTTIDGAQGGNATRHLNHSCAPNVEAVERRGRDGTLSLTVRTLRRIHVDEELFLDYALVIAEREHPSDYPCECLVVACRGTMAAPAAPVNAESFAAEEDHDSGQGQFD